MRRIVPAIAVLLALVTLAAGFWCLVAPADFAALVDFPPSRHFVHDAGAFQLGLGAGLLLAVVWADGFTVALGAYLVGGVAHTAAHIADRDVGGSTGQTTLIAVAAAVAALALVERWRQLGWVLGHVGGTAAPDWAPFVRQKTVALTTFRRDGTPVTTPVSIVVVGDRAYVRSYEKAWKTRRIRNNPAVTVAPSTARGVPTGPAVHAVAHRLTGAENTAAARALRAKYPLLHRVLVPLTHRLGRRTTGRTVHFELELS
ncbi:PPOX class probable F420-dependent enzyme, Rv2061 family [Asanoa hainanensis]|uniref:PPOX class probable F420-dependent enzyme, Rv2061 family n=1 Tax=Asanoa hainanensis TaxID=560556 RepID=A0A239FRA7_9ACTN|nr:PPOX class F420-dependent oxidoreductase [Asanoa hainanensis]SNS59380.1 PPOX class probable F420-dependent enzyme, Rv2061 family [Asanoa hainanensis]